MEVELIMRAAGVAMTVAVSCQILSRFGREDQSSLVSLAGIIAIMLLLVGEISSLIESVRSVFGI